MVDLSHQLRKHLPELIKQYGTIMNALDHEDLNRSTWVDVWELSDGSMCLFQITRPGEPTKSNGKWP